MVLAFTVFYIASHNALIYSRNVSTLNQQIYSSTWLLPSIALEVIAGEFKGLIADLIVLEAGAQLGTEIIRTPEGEFKTVRKQYNWPIISRLLSNSQTLDPRFQHTYMLAQGWLPWEAKMIDETFTILQTAAENRPWDWQPFRLMGFDTYYFLNNPGEAGKIFLKASQTPGAPPYLAILGARLAQKGGETSAAIMLMKSMLATKTEKDFKYQAMVDRLTTLEGVMIIEIAVEKYQTRFGRKPSSINELLDNGIITSLPKNPYGDKYCIDSDGRVQFDNLYCPPPSQ
ncbi:MAG: hypothetical protein KKB30_10145 [Proteobacteria bacterium]|nr:hypothetical protein [Pseudomonadota bacterium]MBU1716410.1 hypothetical protein [Pseudomonadota bacterium]